MKTLVLIASLFCFTLNSHSQAVMEVTNATNCDLMVQLYSVSTGSCNSTVPPLNLFMPAGFATTVFASRGEEFIYTEITSDPWCSGGVALAVGTPMTCRSTCTWGVPSNAVVGNSGCNGCLPNVMADWTDPCNHPGVLYITDF